MLIKSALLIFIVLIWVSVMHGEIKDKSPLWKLIAETALYSLLYGMVVAWL